LDRFEGIGGVASVHPKFQEALTSEVSNFASPINILMIPKTIGRDRKYIATAKNAHC
jgi:hypothetical protein